MTDITDEQRSAWEEVLSARPMSANALAPFLPSELVNPQPVLPNEPGAYRDAHGLITILDPRGRWHGTYGDLINPDICAQPFTRLVPERSQITRERVSRAVADVAQQFGLPVHTASYISALTSALVNGTDRD
jgi:hypothetical protein